MCSRFMALAMAFLAAALVAPALPVAAQSATAVPGFNVADSMSPTALYEALLISPFPEALLPDGVARLDAYEWRDSNDADLAGSLGGVILSDGDPYGSEPTPSIAYQVFADSNGPHSQMEIIELAGEPVDLEIHDQRLPAMRMDLDGVIAVFTVVDNVLVSGLAGSADAGAENLASALTEAVLHLLAVADAGSGASASTDEGGQAAEARFLAMTAAPFPADGLPVEGGEPVVLPEPDPTFGADISLVGSLLVRDAERIYPYPLVFYRFYTSPDDASAYIAGVARAAETSSVLEPAAGDSPAAPITLVDQAGTSRALVQIGATVVIGNAVSGDVDQRHSDAMALAEIAVRHLVDVSGQRDRSDIDSGRTATPSDDRSPEEVYETLLAATFPAELLPEGVGPLETRIWDDPDEPALANAVGGVTYSTRGDDPATGTHTVSFAVFADNAAAEAAFGEVESFVRANDSTDLAPCLDDDLPSILLDLDFLVVCYARINNILITGMIFTLDAAQEQDPADQATALARAGIAFLRQDVDPGAATPASQ